MTAVRNPALDAAKGIAIVLVIVFHVWGGLVSAGRIAETPLGTWTCAFAYTFHVPVFFFVAGLVLADPRRDGYLANIGRRLVYPYVLWSLLQGFVIAASGKAANHAVAPADVIPSIFFHPLHQFWFLHTLILLMVLIGVAVRGGASRPQILAASVGLFLIQLLVPAAPLVLRFVARNAIYLAAGFSIGLPRRLPPPWVALPAFGLLGLAVTAGLDHVEIFDPVLAGLGILGTLALAGGWPREPLCALGRASLALYVGHVLASAPARLLPWSFPVGIALGLALPYALWSFGEAWKLPIFRWPERRAAQRQTESVAF